MATKIYKNEGEKKWYLLDADGIILGRLATVAADILRGKNKATYTPNMDSGDGVIVINAEKIWLSNEPKRQKKTYFRHSGYPGGIKSETFEEAIAKHPEKVIQLAVKGMMPSNKLASAQLIRLRVFAGPEHGMEAQKPEAVELKGEK